MKLFKKLNTLNHEDNPINQAHQDEHQKKLNRKISFRFSSIMVLFTLLLVPIIIRLYQIQISDHEVFVQKAISQFDTTRTQLSARGEIVDRNGQVLVSNQERLSFVYLEPKNETNRSKFQKAVDFVSMFDANIETMAFRDKQDAYIYFYPKEANALITESEMADFRALKLTNNDLYRLQLSRINLDLVNQSLNETQLKQFYTYTIMQSAIGLDVILKETVTAEEVNILLENSEKFLGIEGQINWDRVATKIHNLKPIIGEISTNRQGLPRETASTFIANNYKLNERVGISGVEQYYEDILVGQRTKYNIKYNKDGLATLTEIFSGSKGDTVSLTIDVDFQNQVEQIMVDQLNKYSGKTPHNYFKELYVVVSDPNSGEVLASSGVMLNDKKEPIFSPNSTYLKSYSVGSSIKGAIVYLALDEKIFAPGQRVLDEPIKIAGTPLKKSSAVLGWINDLEALSKSSNVYMFKTVFGLGKANYQYDQPINLSQNAYDKVRSNYSKFGLGITTGLDVPFEETGYKSNARLPGYLLDNVIGQFDTFTAMQLNQYVSTIANGEYRYKMKLINNSYDSQSGLVNFQNSTTVLNTIDNKMAIKRVQEGFRLCVTNGYCSGLNNAELPVAAKTGTSEDFLYVDGKRIDTATNTTVAYAPFDTPEIAISCIAPHFRHSVTTVNGCEEVVKNIINVYAQKQK